MGQADIRFYRTQCLSSPRTHTNAPYFEAAAGDAFKSVEIALVALRFYSEQTHFNFAERAENQGLDGWLRRCIGFRMRANVSHGMLAFHFHWWATLRSISVWRNPTWSNLN
jgi:hypothetical protein